jgi:hypothetical protein
MLLRVRRNEKYPLVKELGNRLLTFTLFNVATAVIEELAQLV